MATIAASVAGVPAVVEPGWAEWRGLVPAGVVLTWVLFDLGVDSVVELTGQRLLGLLTWVLLFVLLRRESTGIRVQVGVVVVFATLVEYCFAGWLGVYVYRLHNVPAFVPPAHGLVYLAALCIGRSALVDRVSRPLVAGTVLIGGVWSLWGVTLAPRRDVLGLVWFGCLLVFMARSRQPLVFAGAFLVVSTIEIVGTALGTWTWSVVDPVMGWVTIGNPPSGAAGGYGWFDTAALVLSPAILRLLSRRPQAGGGGQSRRRWSSLVPSTGLKDVGSVRRRRGPAPRWVGACGASRSQPRPAGPKSVNGTSGLPPPARGLNASRRAASAEPGRALASSPGKSARSLCRACALRDRA